MPEELKILLRAEPKQIAERLAKPSFRGLLLYVCMILIGSGLYGLTLGIWRGPQQSLDTAIKFPLLIFLTCAGNAAINEKKFFLSSWLDSMRATPAARSD